MAKESGPLVTAAIHDGHEVREEVANQLALGELERLRAEDPFTAAWTTIAPTRIIVHTSRFEVDLNRPRAKAVYVRPEDAWGLQVWRQPPSPQFIERSLQQYDAFYREVYRILAELERRFGCFVVLDLHTYSHRRDGPEGAVADRLGNPEVNLGTGSMARERWSPLVDRFVNDLRAFDFFGRPLDVRENVNFRGGHFSQWIHETFPESGCSLAIEFKKSFMDEWSGALDPRQHEAIRLALQSTLPGVVEELERLRSKR
jgi:hypothetical protein